MNIIAYIDRDKFEKIIINLLSNAFKFTPEGGYVNVELSLQGELSPARSTKQSLFNGSDEIASPDIRQVRNDEGYPGFVEITICNSGSGYNSLSSWIKFSIVSIRLMILQYENRKEPVLVLRLQKSL